MLKLELQLDNYIDVTRYHDRFSGLENLVDLSVKPVETNRHKVYDLVGITSTIGRQVLRGHFLVWVLPKPSGEII